MAPWTRLKSRSRKSRPRCPATPSSKLKARRRRPLARFRMRSAASKTRLRKPSTINGHHLHNVRPPQLAASLFLSRRRDVAYADVATWLQLGPLVEVQKNLRALRAQIRAAADDSSAVRRIDTQLASLTVSQISAPRR